MSVNKAYLAWFVIVLNTAGVQMGYSVTYSNQLTNLFNAKFHWDDPGIAHFNQGLIGSALILGVTFGALIGGKLMKIGRRKVQFINIVLGLVGISFTMFLRLETILLGRFLFGMSSGLFVTTIPRYIEETVPSHLYDSIGPLFTYSLAVGTLISYVIGEILPPDTDTEALRNSELWRVFYFYYPGAIFIFLLFSFMFTIKHDSVRFLL